MQALRDGRSVEEAIEVLMISSDEDEPAPAQPAPAAAQAAAHPFDWALHQVPAQLPAPDLRLSQGAQMPALPQSQQGSTAMRESQPQLGSQTGPSARLGSQPLQQDGLYLGTQGSQAGAAHAPLEFGGGAQLRAAVQGMGREREQANMVARAAEARAAALPRAAPASAPAPAQLPLPPQGEEVMSSLACPVGA